MATIEFNNSLYYDTERREFNRVERSGGITTADVPMTFVDACAALAEHFAGLDARMARTRPDDWRERRRIARQMTDFDDALHRCGIDFGLLPVVDARQHLARVTVVV